MAGHLQPISRSSAADDNGVYLWLLRSPRDSFSSSVICYHPNLKVWSVLPTKGIKLLGWYYGACANLGSSLYIYGGCSERLIYDSFYKLDISKTLHWKHLCVHTKKSQMEKFGSAMVVHENKLVVFGGCSHSHACTNELHLYDLSKS